ncbi:Rieske 2Fe-2S domain-containing protein [Catenulispora pinisilvae]|uniref:Rieske 2Fe-2S domain-containing protein n=1 Tax=Catenulispora pinisilvae TaxID=2705253 RepID=UPI001890B66E|nr:Rieske 2Fe-2S domain-containing protein [Catenulispora pinisilvae]
MTAIANKMTNDEATGAEEEVKDPVYTGPGTVAGRLMRSYWQPVKKSQDVPNGTAHPLTVMGEQFTLYRGRDGQAAVLAPRCAHRLTVLSVGTVEDGGLRCMFHGWKFGPDGRCLEAPGESEALVRKASVRSYPTREAYGLIFVFLGRGAEPPFPDLAGFSREHGHDFESAAVIEPLEYTRRCNFFSNVENGVDHAHVPFTHRLSSDPNRTKEGFSPAAAHQTPITVHRGRSLIHTREIDQDSPYRATFLMPNALHLVVAGRNGLLEQFAWRVPIDDEVHMSFGVMGHFLTPEGVAAHVRRREEVAARREPFISAIDAAELIIAGKAPITDFLDHPDLVNLEDHVAQVGMGRLADRENERLGESDKGVVQVRRMWRRHLDAFDRGEPLDTTWA